MNAMHPPTPFRRNRRNRSRATLRTLLPGLALLLAACGGDNATGPEIEPAPRYDLDVRLVSMNVFDNCEDAAGNPGEFNWQAVVRVGAGGLVAVAGTPGYPSSGSVLSWQDGTNYTLNESLSLRGISEAQRDSVTITLAATEWDFHTDPPSRDPDMNDARQTNPLERGGVVGLATGARCALRLGYQYTWTAQ